LRRGPPTTRPSPTRRASRAIAFTRQLALENAAYGVRANVILPGLMDTPMAVDTRARVWGKTRGEVAAARDARVPLRGKMGTAWDVANAALFLASDEANFITGVALWTGLEPAPGIAPYAGLPMASPGSPRAHPTKPYCSEPSLGLAWWEKRFALPQLSPCPNALWQAKGG
jgi:hypothetical protein